MELTRIQNIMAQRESDRDEWFVVEYDPATDQTGIIITYPGSEVGVQNGLTPGEFVSLYPDFEELLPSEPHVVSFLEFATIEAFEANDLEKAYVIYTESSAFEGITGYPISIKEDIRSETQIAVPATEANLAKIPQEVLQHIPQVDNLMYIRYNDDYSRISYEREYTITSLDTMPSVIGVNSDVLRQCILDVDAALGIDEVKMVAKHTIGGEVPKLYFALSYCEDCRD